MAAFLKTESVELRPFQENEDGPALLRWWNHPDSRVHLPGPGTPVESIWDLHPFCFPRPLALAICEPDEGPLLGFAALYGVSQVHSRATLLLLVDPDERRRGRGRDAGRLLCDYAFDELGLELVWAALDESNAAGRALASALGFRQSARLSDWSFRGGRRVDRLLLSLRRSQRAPVQDSSDNPWVN